MSHDLANVFARLEARPVHGIAAVLLPYEPEGDIDWTGFERRLADTHAAGLDCAVNMDTGFGDLLDARDRRAVLDETRRVLGDGIRFYAGAYVREGEDPLSDYARSIAEIDMHGAIPVIVQCRAMHAMSAREKAALYADVSRIGTAGAIAFELSPLFAPHGEIWDAQTFTRLLDIETLLGAKHSSLDRGTELERLAARDRARPDFRVYTGNDLAIDMVAYGSDYLLGLATFAPARFAERDRLLAAGDASFLGLNDALQHLGNVGFRTPIPAYKHAAAQFLHLCGRLETDAVHPSAARRPDSDRILLYDCALRLRLIDDPARAWEERVARYVDA